MMVRAFLACCVVWSVASAAGATTYFVSGVGNDAANGLTATTAFRTLQHAADLTNPGDVVVAMDGTYSIGEGQSAGAVLSISRSGTADRWIVYKAMAGQTPKIETKQWNGVFFGPTAAYVELSGFTVTGNAAHIDPAAAIKRANVAKPVPDPAYDGNCIAIDGRHGTLTQRSHHIRILNNTVGQCGGGGVAVMQADYITISGNTIYDCAWYSMYGTSGISTLESWNSDEATGYKMVITRNRLFGNKELVWWEAQGKITDGEAIIIDTLRSPTIGAYKGRTLVADNVIYGNGSAAIEVFRSDHVDVVHNSTYRNVTVLEESGRGELNLNEASDINVVNNIFVSGPGQNPIEMNTNQPCGCRMDSNLYFGGELKPGTAKGAGGLVGDPKYLNVELKHPWTVDLRVATDSPALRSGVPTNLSIPDFAGRERAKGAKPNRGAFEQ